MPLSEEKSDDKQEEKELAIPPDVDILGASALSKCMGNLNVGVCVRRKDKDFIVVLNYNSTVKVRGAPTMCQA